MTKLKNDKYVDSAGVFDKNGFTAANLTVNKLSTGNTLSAANVTYSGSASSGKKVTFSNATVSKINSDTQKGSSIANGTNTVLTIQ